MQALDLPSGIKSAVIPKVAGGGGVPQFFPEHLSLRGVGSYFWSLGTRVGGLAQLQLQCRSFTTRPPPWGPAIP